MHVRRALARVEMLRMSGGKYVRDGLVSRFGYRMPEGDGGLADEVRIVRLAVGCAWGVG